MERGFRWVGARFAAIQGGKPVGAFFGGFALVCMVRLTHPTTFFPLPFGIRNPSFDIHFFLDSFFPLPFGVRDSSFDIPTATGGECRISNDE